MKMASHCYSSEKLEEIDEQLIWQSEQHIHHDMDDDDDNISEEDELMIEGASSMSSSPSIPDENINFDLVYALHTFVATVEGQASVVKGDALILMEDTNIYWWLVEVLKTREVGYIPAENIETPYERLARLNKHRNVEITSPSIQDSTPSPIQIAHPLHPPRRVTIGDESMSKIFHYEVETEIDEDEEDMLEEDDSIHSERGQDNFQDAQSGEFQEMVMDSYDEQGHTAQEWQEKSWDQGHPQQDEQQPALQEQMQLLQTAQEHVSSSLEITPQLLSKEEEIQQEMELRVFAGNIGQGPLFHTFTISITTAADELIRTSVNKFGMMDAEQSDDTTIEYYLAVQGMDGDEYILSAQDKPFSIFKTLTDSLTTPMPSFSHVKRISQQSLSSLQSRNSTSRRPRSSSFSNYEQTSYDEDSVIRFYLHRRIKRAHEREGLLYIKVSLYPDDSVTSTNATTVRVPNRDNSAFIKNPTPTKSKKRQPALLSRSEIDRIDKIIAVRRESLIGAVINLALEKFHVPDAQADNYPGKNERIWDSRQLGKYRMSVRGNGQEIELHPNQLMSDVLLQQQSSSPNHSGPITSDLLFVVRKAGSMVKQSQKQRHPPKGSQYSHERMHPDHLPTAMTSEDRRPSILDILMYSTPRMGERRPSVMSSLLESPPRSTEDVNNRRLSGCTINNNCSNQERKLSLNHQVQQQQQSPSSSSSSFQTSKSPNSLLGFNRRSSAQSSSVISGSSIDDERNIHSDSTIVMDNSIQVTPTSSSSVMRSQQPSISTERKKESFKQQLKRLVGWGSSSSNKKQQTNQPPSVATPFSNNTSAIVDYNSHSDISFISAPSTPLPPTPSTLRSIPLPKSRQGSTSHHPLEVNNPIIISRRPSETMTLNDPSAAAIAAAAAVTAASKRLSAVSSVSTSSSSTTSVTLEEIAAATNQALGIDEDEEENEDDDDGDTVDDDVQGDANSDGYSDDNNVDASTAATALSLREDAVSKKSAEEPVVMSIPPPSASPESAYEDASAADIQTQYAMWMHSQTNISVPEEATPVPPNKSTSQTLSSTKALTAMSTPSSRSSMQKKSSTISNNTSIMSTTSTPPTSSVAVSTPAQSNYTTSTPSLVSTSTTNKVEVEESLHPMSSNNGQDLDDLFLLVAHGVDFLTTRENTKWEEEGGYEFHPWNRPQSSFSVRQQQQQQKNSDNSNHKASPMLQDNHQYDQRALEQNVSISAEEIDVEAENTEAALDMARSLLLSSSTSEASNPMSPPLTPIPQQRAQKDNAFNDMVNNVQQSQQPQESPLSIAKRVLGANAEVKAPIPQTQQPLPQQHQSVDDEELQRIVASHIVF